MTGILEQLEDWYKISNNLYFVGLANQFVTACAHLNQFFLIWPSPIIPNC
jgi:hypothetical protein